MTKALLAGTFDPPTQAHMALVAQAAGIFSELVVAIPVNPNKNPMFPLSLRVEWLNAATAPFDNVRVDSYDGLTAAYAERNGIDILVRGLRDHKDFAYEKELAQANALLGDGLPTLFLLTQDNLSAISAGMIREAILFGAFDRVAAHVPEQIRDSLRRHLARPSS